MKPKTKFYLKTILRLSVLYGIIAIIINFIIGLEIHFVPLLLTALFFGLIMTLIVSPNYFKEIKKLGISEFTDDILSTYQQKEVIADLSKEELLNRLKSDPFTGYMKFNEVDDVIILKSTFSTNSFGEIIQIKLKAAEGEGTRFLISSKPKLAISYFDNGKNLQNVEYIKKLIEKVM